MADIAEVKKIIDTAFPNVGIGGQFAKLWGESHFSVAEEIYRLFEQSDIEKIRDAFNRGYEKGYAKGKADELQVIRQAQADRDFYDWKKEIKKE